MFVCLSLIYDDTKLLRFQAIFFHVGEPATNDHNQKYRG